MTRIFLLCFTLLVAGASSSPAPPINGDAEAIARSFPKSSLKGGNLGSASGQMKNMISTLTKTGRNSRSSLRAAVEKALDFRDDIGPNQKAATATAILTAWETAVSYGALNEKMQFTGRATMGRYAGQKLVFENIVPAELAPEFAGYVGNVRLVAADQARKKEDPVTIREQGFLVELQNIREEFVTREAMLEREKSKVKKLAMTKDDSEARYQAEVELAGDMVKQPPNLSLSAQRLSSPSKMNGNRYRVLFEVANLSRHPTEVELEYKIVGYTDNDNLLYEMQSGTKTLKLRRSEIHEVEVWTENVSKFKKPLEKFDPNKSTKVYYRGYLMIAKFEGKVIGSTGSDGRMQRIASGENSTPIPKL